MPNEAGFARQVPGPARTAAPLARRGPRARLSGRVRQVAAAVAACLLLGTAPAQASDYERLTLGPADSPDVLVIDASTNTDVFQGVLQDFSALYPGMRIEYTELPTRVLYDAVLARADRDPQARTGPDLIISSSMDLQTKLVNDGHAQAHRSPETLSLPAWANWRDEVFSIGAEALVMAYDTRQLDADKAPRTRRELLAMLRGPDQPLAGRIATYDAEQSGIGYLAATQDARLDSMAGGLLAAFGANGVVVAESADGILDRVVNGEIALAYNMLESYAQRRIANGAPLAIVRPEDYTLVLSRAALIPRQAPRPDLGARFLDYLLSERGQYVISRESGMLRVRGPDAAHAGPAARPVGLGVGLLVYLDELKRGYFLRSWREALCLDCAAGGGR